MTTKEVSQITGFPEQALRLMAQQKVISWGIAYKGTGKQWVYQWNQVEIKKQYGGLKNE